MKIIDEKGMLFGKVNVIDFLAILFLLFFIPIFYFVFKMPKPVVVQPKVFIDIEHYCKFIKIEPEVLKKISVGDKEVDPSGAVIGEIVWIGESRSYQYNLDIGLGSAEIKDDSLLKELNVKLKIKVDVQDNLVYYKDKQVMKGQPFEFKTNKYKVSVVLNSEKPRGVENLDLPIILKGLDENTLKLIAVGDKELDEKGEIIAEIIRLGKIVNDVREVNLGNGNFILAEDSGKKQIFTTMRLKCEEAGGANQLYFKNRLISDNSLFYFETDKYTTAGKIARAYENPVSPLKEKWVSLQVKFSGIIPELAMIINEGDTEKDATNRAVGRMRAIVSNKPAELLSLKDDKLVILSHPFQRDIVVLLDALCVEKDGVLYFKNWPVKIGNMITLTADLYTMSGVIIGVEIK